MSGTDMPELLPCPFCGSDRLHAFPPTCHQSTPYDPKDRMYSIVMCMNCSAYAAGKNNDGPRDDRSTTSAIERWNTRAAPTKEQVAAMVPELVWENFDAWTWWCCTELGTYRVNEREGDWRATLGFGASSIHRTVDYPGNCETSAKAAAQADYTRRILAALFPEGET